MECYLLFTFWISDHLLELRNYRINGLNRNIEGKLQEGKGFCLSQRYPQHPPKCLVQVRCSVDIY